MLRWFAHPLSRALGAVALALTGGLARADWFAPPRWPELKQEIRAKFPEVPQLSAEQLLTATKETQGVLLLDVRDKAEFEVSHLKSAHWAPDADTARQWIHAAPKSTQVVLYCSVGWRSSVLARELIRSGEARVYNLEGSIFEWANQGLPVYQGEAQVQKVHPYNARWGQLLRAELRARP